MGGRIFGGFECIWSFAVVNKYKKHAKTECRKDGIIAAANYSFTGHTRKLVS